MPNPPSPAAAAAALRPSEPWAEVRARDHVMRYRRAGAGRAVVVLHPAHTASDGAALWPGTADALVAARFRVIVPELLPTTTDAGDVAVWLLDFLDGLGAEGVAVVATEPLCVAALELALLDADRVSRVVLVPGGRADETGLDGALATSTRASSVPLLVVRRGLPAADALPLVTRFLSGREAAAPTG
ncbi:MAG TPA: hypothetical protein VFJ74_17750 [Gemmatimonadaceae bacterium]|nr:hypothetical protein [Gemmatimonadaceae bacterium]